MKKFTVILLGLVCYTLGQYPQWTHQANIMINTTPDFGNIQRDVNNFPLLIRLNQDNFNFSQAHASGNDVRFSENNNPISYQIERWDNNGQEAEIWVKVNIKGNGTQLIGMHWGNTGASSESNGGAVFGNSFDGVYHFSGTLQADASASNNDGTPAGGMNNSSLASGIIGTSANFDGSDDILRLPGNNAFELENSWSMEAWIKTGVTGTIFAHTSGDWCNGAVKNWFVESRLNLVVYDACLIGPSSNANQFVTDDKWHHLSLTIHGNFQGDQDSINFFTDGVYTETQFSNVQNLPNVGGPQLGYTSSWYPPDTENEPNWSGSRYYTGLMDEFRYSNIQRSPEWVKLSYNNQKANQNVVGYPILSTCTDETINAPAQITVREMETHTFTNINACALFIQTYEVINGQESLVSSVRKDGNLIWGPGRREPNKPLTLRIKALFASGEKTKDVAVTVTDVIPEPIFKITETVPMIWDGATPLKLTPEVINLAAITNSSSPTINYNWSTTLEGGGFADTTLNSDGSIVLNRASRNAKLDLSICLDNDGPKICQSWQIIADLAGPLSLVNPNGGEKLDPATKYTIVWNSDNTITDIHLQYTVGGGIWSNIALNQTNSGSYEWDVPNVTTATAKIRILKVGGGAADSSATVFGIGVDPSTNVSNVIDFPFQFYLFGSLQFILHEKIESVEITSLGGRRIKRIRIENDEAAWNGESENGKTSPSGIYLVRMTSGNRQYIKKIYRR